MRKGLSTLAAVGLLATGGTTACAPDAAAGAGGAASRQGRRDPARHQELRPLGDRRPQVPRRRRSGGRGRGRHPERPGRQGQFQTIADGMITSGVNVLMIVNLDSGTGKAVLDKAKAAGIATIDYDRLTLTAAPTTTSASTTSRSASSRARAWSSA